MTTPASISSIGEFLEVVRDLPSTLGRSWVFRGVGDANYPFALLPSVARFRPRKRAGRKRGSRVANERDILERFWREGLPYLRACAPEIATAARHEGAEQGESPITRARFPLEIIALAQHFGVPTRMLDWTRNPLCALFFAVTTYEPAEGAVYATIPLPQKREGNIELNNHHELFYYSPPHVDQRIAAQAGLLSVHPYDKKRGRWTTVDETRSNPIALVRTASKKDLEDELLSLNIGHAMMFPGLSGLAQNLRRRFCEGLNAKDGTS